MVLCICTTTKYNSRLSHNIYHSKIKSRQVHFTMPLIFPSRNAQDTVRPYETNPSLRPMLRTGASEELINMNLHQTYVDNYFDILQANATTPLLGPYTTPWIPGALTLWSKSLIEHGKFESADAALLAFTVDCAMKVYITADLDLPCLELRGDDDIVWTLIFEAYWAAVRNQQPHAGRQGASISAVDNFPRFGNGAKSLSDKKFRTQRSEMPLLPSWLDVHIEDLAVCNRCSNARICGCMGRPLKELGRNAMIDVKENRPAH
jgi:hypothetical protein